MPVHNCRAEQRSADAAAEAEELRNALAAKEAAGAMMHVELAQLRVRFCRGSLPHAGQPSHDWRARHGIGPLQQQGFDITGAEKCRCTFA